MVNETMSQSYEEHNSRYISAIVEAANEFYNTTGEPVKILDLATGPNGFNPKVIKRLISESIPYRLVLTDISPIHFSTGYENLRSALPEEELENVVAVLADSMNLRKDLRRTPLWDKRRPVKLEKILGDERFRFLHSGYDGSFRKVDFNDCSFDLIIGGMPYGSINARNYNAAIFESARVLRIDGYHIVDEFQVEELNLDIERTRSAIRRANRKHIVDVRERLDAVLTPIEVISYIYEYSTDEKIPEQTLQNGDVVKNSILVHQKKT